MLEIYTYFSFEDFEKNYQDDLKDWLNYYSNGTEPLYLEELKNKYSFFIENNSINLTDIKAFPIYPIMNNSSNKYSRISLNKLALILEERINYVLSNNIQIFNNMVEEKTPYENQNPFKNPALFIYNDEFNINEFDTDDYLDINMLEDILPFFNFRDRDEYGYKNRICIVNINEQKVKDFQLAIKQVLIFINNKRSELESENTNLYDIAFEDVDFNTVVKKIIALNEMGIIDFLYKKSPYNTSIHRMSEDLSKILGLKTKTLDRLIRCVIYNKTGDDNYPYKNEETVDEVKNFLDRKKNN